MNTHLTEIAFILDRSGSMASITESTIAGFNQFLREQQTAPGLARLTVVLFDDEYLVPIRSIPVAEVTPLTTATYVTRGSTALLDAIGRTIDELGQRLAATPEADRPGKVIITILTDGEENASTKYNWTTIAKRIRHQTKKYAWEFLFLGANQDAIATAAQLNIKAANSATFLHDGIGVTSSMAAINRKSKAFRASAAGSMTAQESADAAAPMEHILAEEDTNRRE